MADKTQTILSVLKDFLLKGGSLLQLKKTMAEFEALVKQETKEHTALITPAYPLKEDEKTKITDQINSVFSNSFDYEFNIDKQVLGGIKVQMYDYVIDLTLNKTLNDITQNLKL